MGMSLGVMSDSIKLVVFKLTTEEFGIEITKINSIIRMEKITKIPYAADFIEGIINYRNHPLVVIDLRKRFGLPALAKNLDNMRIIVLDFQPFLIGMVVDHVSEVLSLPYSMIEPVPDNLLSLDIEQEYLLGVGNMKKGERLIILLDLAKIFSDDELSELSLIFNQEKEIKKYLEKSREDEERRTEEARLKASQAAQLAAGSLSSSISDYNLEENREEYLEMERNMIRKLALRDLQEELGISIDDHSNSKTRDEVIYLEEGETLDLEDDEDVEYIYVDDEGNEIDPSELEAFQEESESEDQSDDLKENEANLDESNDFTMIQGTMLEDDEELPSDVAELIAAAEDEESMDSGDPKESLKNANKVEISQADFDEYVKKIGYLTKKEIRAYADGFPNLELPAKARKDDLIENVAIYMRDNNPEELLRYIA